MANVKRNIVNWSAAIIGVLFIIGAINMQEVMPLIDYVNMHTTGWITFLYYSGAILLFFVFPLVVGAAIEEPLYTSNTRIGQEISIGMANARNEWGSFIAFGLSGGMVTFFSCWGIITLVCG